MKAVLVITLSFLFASLTNLPLGLSKNDAEPVFDVGGNPLQLGGKYYILPAIRGPPGGGVRLGKTENSNCPVTVLQDYSEVINGLPVEFNIPGVHSGVIFTGVTPLDIEFTKKPNCAENSQWSLFEDNKIEETYVGIGGPGNHPGQQMLSGMFRIQKYGPQKYNSYKLVFCPDASSTCSNIGRYDNEEGGRRLVLTQDRPYEVIFVNAYNRDATIKSVV